MDQTIWRVRARNTAVTSDNKIHDDEVARAYGFAGGLVPGVDVFAYLTHVPAERWGLDWLSRGTIAARFARPVYDGDEVTVTAEGDALTLRNGAGETCATATIALPEPTGEARPAPDAGTVPPAPLPGDRPPASPDSLAPGTVLGSLEFGFHAAHAGDYLADVGETLPLYGENGIAHPGWLLRSANAILVANVRLGPWIHVSSDVTFHSLVHDGDALETRARVDELFERKGHRFVRLDVVILAATRPVLRAAHTAIYEPRRATS